MVQSSFLSTKLLACVEDLYFVETNLSIVMTINLVDANKLWSANVRINLHLDCWFSVTKCLTSQVQFSQIQMDWCKFVPRFHGSWKIVKKQNNRTSFRIGRRRSWREGDNACGSMMVARRHDGSTTLPIPSHCSVVVPYFCVAVCRICGVFLCSCCILLHLCKALRCISYCRTCRT